MNWLPIETAPKDGTDVYLLIRHPNWELAGAHDRDKWEQAVTGHWIDNRCGWTWDGIYGVAVGWQPTPLPQRKDCAVSLFSVMRIYCCICAIPCDGMKSYGSSKRVCSKECCDELHWRETLAIMGKEYRPRETHGADITAKATEGK